jgi:translation elongation factor EF-1alpha
MNGSKIGTVSHYYDKIKVAILNLTSDLKVGDTIKFVRGGEELFSQNVDSIQVEHKSIDTAGSGDVVGLKVENDVKEGAEVFKVE